MKIALLEPLGIPEERIEELAAPIRAAGHSFTYYPQKTTDPAELIRRSADCDAVMIANNPYPNAVVEACPNLKLVDVAFTGIDHVGTAACKAHGVTVCNAAAYSDETVAELVIGMTIALLRKLPECNTAVRNGGTSQGLRGREIAGRTVGIVGTGRIGLRTAALFTAFGAKVIAYSRSVRPEAEAMGVTYVSLETLMSESDIVTLHIPNNASTRGMIGRELIGLMKPTALLINCARGPVLDGEALADALNEDRIAGAGIDVYNGEPPLPAVEPLLHAKNTVLAPHVGFLSDEAMERRARIVFKNLTCWLNGNAQNVCEL